MDTPQQKALEYKRSNFVTVLPVDYLYSPSHFWIAQVQPGQLRVGLTKFATRMLGEMVDQGLKVEPGTPVQSGQIIGWIEGFKAISDVFCIGTGQFKGTNPALKEKITLINQDPYGTGWLYSVQGEPDSKCMGVNAYRELLDKTIDRLMAQQKGQ